MESETASSVDEQVVAAVASVGAAAGADSRGRHRILAELKRVEQEIKCLEVRFFLGILLLLYCFLLCYWNYIFILLQ